MSSDRADYADYADDPHPTRVRYLVVAVTAVAALWMYIDRVCFSTLAPGIRDELGIDKDHMSFVLGAFFFTYALFQIPIGSLADRYGPRAVLTIAIVAWSLCTAATSLAVGAGALLLVRLGLGVCEAGAYPAAAGLVRRWASAEERGRLSSIVAFGGRIGGAAAPFLTAFAAVTLLGDPVTRTQNWRGVFLLYGALGLGAAVLFWLVARDAPAAHPRANPAEAARVPPAPPLPASPAPWIRRVLALTASRNMWLFGGLQFFVNVSWAFLITSLPDYLKDRFDSDTEAVGRMQTVALAIGCAGMALGGLFADAMFRWFGPRWGRSAPLAVVMLACAVTYLSATVLPTAWAVIVALGLMAFLVDLANPTIWAFAQDVGGRYVGASLGWGNMLGNFGAAVSPVLLQIVRKSAGWDVAFLICAGSFVLAAACGVAMNALIPVAREIADPEAEDYREP
jgi:ACS family glucarate transporter-like MFS transporter